MPAIAGVAPGGRLTTEPNPIACGKAVYIAERDGRKLLLQCKGRQRSVGVEAVQQVHT